LNYFFLVCAKSEAATLFAALLDLGLLKILDAIEATFFDVCLEFGIILTYRLFILDYKYTKKISLFIV
jgi:hypothetical protein